MDYKYIEQLLERYWECQTTLEEETILHKFFAQADIPASLLPYACLFHAEDEMANEHLGKDFDERILKAIEPKAEETKTRIVSLHKAGKADALRPLWRAAAVVAIVLSIGMAAQQGFQRNGEEETTLGPSLADQGDTIELFVDQPELSPQTEAVLAPTQADTMKMMTP